MRAEAAIPFTKIVEGLPSTIPFTGPETLERLQGKMFSARIGANESAFGVSPKAQLAMRTAIEQASWYGDPESFELRSALAKIHNVEMDEIVVGAGIDEILGNIVRMVVEPGLPVVTSLGAYPTFNYHIKGFGGKIETVPFSNDHEDPNALLDRAAELRAPLFYLSNPDNPMGSWHNANTVQEMIDNVPKGSILILDEAYADFAKAEIIPEIDTGNPRVIRLRTFSKAHGLAGARIGYAIANKHLIGGIAKIRNHFGVNRIAQEGALASLQDKAFLASVLAEVERGRAHYTSLAKRLGMKALPSMTNFVAIDVGGAERAQRLLTALQEKGVFIRMPGVAPLNRCIRVTIGTKTEREIFENALTSLIEEGL